MVKSSSQSLSLSHWSSRVEICLRMKSSAIAMEDMEGVSCRPSGINGLYWISTYGVPLVTGVPQKKHGLFHGKSQSKMDDLGVPRFRKPPYLSILQLRILGSNSLGIIGTAGAKHLPRPFSHQRSVLSFGSLSRHL